MFLTELTVKEVTVFRAANSLNKALVKYNFLGIYKIFNITNSANLDCQMRFLKGMISFDYSSFNIDDYSFFLVHMKLF